MPGFFNTILDMLSYKEPQTEELGFELLEDENKGVEQEETQNASNTEQKNDKQPQDETLKQSNIRQQGSTLQQSNTQSKKNISSKQPLTVEEWNVGRKNESTEGVCRPQNNTDIISTELCVNLETIRQKFLMPKNQDVIIREFKIGRKVKAIFAYIDGMMDKQTLNLAIFPQLMSRDVFNELGKEHLTDYLIENILAVHDVRKTIRNI